MDKLLIFTDGSVNPKINIGFAAYLQIKEEELLSKNLKEKINIKMYKETSSTKLELQGLLWALGEIDHSQKHIIVYTDCQNIIGLENRRKRFEENNYKTKKNELIANHELYKKFYQFIDQLNCEFIKVKGHKTSSEKDLIDNIFTLVDKASRDALREHLR